MDKQKRLLTVKEFAKEYGFGVGKAYEIVRTRNFPMFKVGKKIYIISNKIENFFENSIGNNY